MSDLDRQELSNLDNVIQYMAGVGIGLVFSGLITATSRNPALRPQLFSYAILGFALSEATGLFALMIAFLLLFAL